MGHNHRKKSVALARLLARNTFLPQFSRVKFIANGWRSSGFRRKIPDPKKSGSV